MLKSFGLRGCATIQLCLRRKYHVSFSAVIPELAD